MAKTTTSTDATESSGKAVKTRRKPSAKKAQVSASSTRKATTGKRAGSTSSRSGADWDAAKDILAAHRTLARAEKRETDIAAGLEAHKKALRALDKQSAALSASLARASEELETATSTRRKVAKKLHKLESATPRRKQ